MKALIVNMPLLDVAVTIQYFYVIFSNPDTNAIEEVVQLSVNSANVSPYDEEGLRAECVEETLDYANNTKSYSMIEDDVRWSGNDLHSGNLTNLGIIAYLATL